jgi:hypothetical protein
MTETTKEARDEAKRALEFIEGDDVGVTVLSGYLRALLNDADRLAELEVEVNRLEEKCDNLTNVGEYYHAKSRRYLLACRRIHREWKGGSEVLKMCQWFLGEAEAKVERLTAIEAAAKRFVDMWNEWDKNEVRLPFPLDYAGSADKMNFRDYMAYLGSLLVETEIERAARETRAERDARRLLQVLSQRREEVFRRRLPRACQDAESIARDDWTPLRRKLHATLERRPTASVLLVGSKGTAKTTGLAYEALRAIRAGRTVKYMAGLDWSKRYRDFKEHVADLVRADLLLIDEAGELAKATRLVIAMAHGVIDRRYQQRKQTHCAVTFNPPAGVTQTGIPWAYLDSDPFPGGMFDRFKPAFADYGKSKRREG